MSAAGQNIRNIAPVKYYKLLLYYAVLLLFLIFYYVCYLSASITAAVIKIICSEML